MKFRLRTAAITLLCVFASLIASAVFAQSKSELSPEQRTKNIEKFWAEHPKLKRRVFPSKDGSMEIPELVLKGIEFEFQQAMALSGHGVLFNAKGQPTELSKKQAFKLQEQMLEIISKEKPEVTEENEKIFKKLDSFVEELERDIRRIERDRPLQRFALQNLRLRALSYRLRPLRRDIYRWRGAYLWRHLIIIPELKLDLRVVRWRGILHDILNGGRSGNNDYVEQCRDALVPIPPVWTPSSTAWADQGALQQKMLSPGANAQVWTWADPHNRGGCVALPRGTGTGSDVAGIICQNAANGNACIWDNISLSTGNTLPWATTPLDVNELEGAPELASNCTTCHSGNNVFLVSPDDPTWCKLLRGGQAGAGCNAITGQNKQNFTLQVEGNVNMLSGHPRYTILSGTPPRAGWTNNAAAGCGGSCHLNGTNVGPPAMPPACGANCN